MDKIIENPLINYGINLTEKAKAGKLDKVYGRDEEMERATQILSRRKKNNLLLVGNPGCVLPNTMITIRKKSNEIKHDIIITE